jgi:hypothetical protein
MKATRSGEHGLWMLLLCLAASIVGGAGFVMLRMDAGSRVQGGRYYVAIGALVLLAVLDKQIERVVVRRAPLYFGVSPPERRYAAVSLVLWLLSAVVLVALAVLLP